MKKDIDYYAEHFSRLKVDRTNKWTSLTANGAPHKPFLMLALLDLFSEGGIIENGITFTYELGELFDDYWRKIMPMGSRGNLALPFFHLRTSRFWHLLPHPEKEAALAATKSVSSLSGLQSIVIGARLDDELFVLLHSAQHRERLRDCILARYFSPEARQILLKTARLNISSHEFGMRLIELARAGAIAEACVTERREGVRKQGFRKAIVNIYEHRCALCGVRMMTASGRSVVDAAHIVPWCESACDEIQNGMALCRLCHWSYDEGMVFISDDYKVLLSSEIKSEINLPGHLLTLARRPIMGPTEEALWPSIEYLRRHRKRFHHA